MYDFEALCGSTYVALLYFKGSPINYVHECDLLGIMYQVTIQLIML